MKLLGNVRHTNVFIPSLLVRIHSNSNQNMFYKDIDVNVPKVYQTFEDEFLNEGYTVKTGNKPGHYLAKPTTGVIASGLSRIHLKEKPHMFPLLYTHSLIHTPSWKLSFRGRYSSCPY